MRERRTVEWRDDGCHTWFVYVDEREGRERTVLQDKENERAWLDSSMAVDVLP